MKILLLWADERSPNLGVRALGEGTAALCRRLWPNAVIDSQNYGHGPSPVNIGSSKSLLRELVTDSRGTRTWLRGYDLVIDTRAGDSFADIYGVRRLVQMSVMAEFVRLCGVPLVMGPQTIGPFTGRGARLLAAWSLRRARAVLARDTTSALAAAELHRPVDATTTDVVFALPAPPAEGKRDVVLNPSGLLWATSAHGDPNRYRACMRTIIEGLLARGRQVSLLAHVLHGADSANPDDDEPAVAALAEEYGLEQVIPRDLTHARALLGGANLVIGSRMHACLNAISVGTPAVPLAYSRKFAPLLGALGLTDVVDLRADEDPAASVLAIVDRMGPGGGAGVQTLRQAAERLLGRAEQVLGRFGPADDLGSRAGTGADLLRTAVTDVVAAGNCSGCGACALLDERIAMDLDDDGRLRPVFAVDPSATQPAVGATSAAVGRQAVQRFDAVCPGRTVAGQHAPGAVRHPMLGPVLGSWAAWAADEELRFAGSSGGALSALAAWMLESGRVDEVVTARADASDPIRTITTRLVDHHEVLATAGSRYAPVGNAAHASLDPRAAFVGKPCEASAVRALAAAQGRPAPVLLSFFCAGTPSQHATEALLDGLGVAGPVRDLWYRGHGWPGHFTVTDQAGAEHRVDYDRSWGDTLGPTIQWRCKICPDGVGESADVVAADFWRADDRGYPLFEEADGVSALIARTDAGVRLVTDAIAAGVITTQPLDPDDLARVQPFQVQRRATLWGRLLGARLAGVPVPRYVDFGLVRLAAGRPRQTLTAARGTYSRLRARK